MPEEIRKNLYRVPVPLPGNPLKELNSYVIKGSDRTLVVDTGFRQEPCRRALFAGLRELGVHPEETDVLLTHLHSDHTGLAPEIAGPNSKIFMSREDSRRLREFQRSANTHRTEEYTLQGFSLDETAFLRDSPMRKYNSVLPMDNTYVGEGDVLEYGGRRLRVIMTPGHTPGHICLYDPDAKVMFLGDHVLFDITPNITTWLGFSDPLGTYVHSLMDISIFDVRLPLPAHRGVSGTMAERVGKIIEHLSLIHI